MSRMSRFVGRSGEKRFSALCSDKEVSCNPAQEDDHGWDHVVQFPHKSEGLLPADLQKSLPAIFVQAKTQASENSSVRMKLSNALALARSPNPCFVVVPPSKQSDDKRWRSFHFWEQAIEQTLKRARQAATAGVPENQLHKKWITFKLTEADWHEEDNLLSWIERSVRDTTFDYAHSKTSLLSTVGFDAERFVGTIEFAPMNSIEELIDHQIGLTETIPVGKFELRDRRFGMEVKIPIPTGPGMIGTIHAHPRECLLRLRGPDDTEIELDCDFIVGSLPGLPIEQCKFRVRSDFVEFVTSVKGTSHFSLKYNTADKYSPVELEKRIRLLSWAGDGTIDVQVWIDDKRLFGGHADIDARRDHGVYQRLCPLVRQLVSLSSHLRLTQPTISIEDIVAAEKALTALQGFLTGPEMNASALLEVESLPADIDKVLTYGFTDVGSWRFGALTEWRVAHHSLEGNVWALKLSSRRVIGRYAYEITDESGFAAFDSDFGRSSAEPGILVMDDNAVARIAETLRD